MLHIYIKTRNGQVCYNRGQCAHELDASSTTNVWETHAASQTWSIMHREDYSQAQDLALEIAGST